MAALTLLTVTVYLRQQGRNYWYTLVPMIFMMCVTVSAMVYNLQLYYNGGQVLLTAVAACIFVLSLWLAVEAVVRFRKDRIPHSVPVPAGGD